MQLHINGETRHFPESDLTITSLLAALELVDAKVAVERNLEIIPRSLYGQTPLCDSDRLEIVQFMGGG